MVVGHRKHKNRWPHSAGANFNGLIFAIWGLAFNPGTDDIREAPSLAVIQELIAAGARILAHDSVVMETMRSSINSEWIVDQAVVFEANQYDVLSKAGGLILATEWKPFWNQDSERIITLLNTPVISDGRNQYDPLKMEILGIE